MDYKTRYFFVTTNFVPDYSSEFIHVQGDRYRHSATGDLYRRRLLLDQGWGQEPGYEREPALSFRELICLITFRHSWTPLCMFSRKLREQNAVYVNNYYGAVAVIMQDYVEELIQFLTEKTDTDFFDDPYIRKQFQLFSFCAKKTKTTGGCILAEPFEAVLKRYDTWNYISEKVINQVYR